MKLRLPIMILLSAVSICLCCSYDLFAANPVPSDCISLTGFYPRAPDDVTYYTFGNLSDTYQGYKPYFRVFIPPGTVVEALDILDDGKQTAVARHKVPPTGLPEFPPIGYPVTYYPYTLTELESADRWSSETNEGFLYITADSFYPYLDISRAGWMYVKVGGGNYSSVYITQFIATVDTKIYNDWWDKYIKNEAGWNMYVQNVGTYIDPTASAPILAVDPTNQAVPDTSGTTTFYVSNSGTGTMPWTAVVISGSDWLSITSGSSGSDAGTITCDYTANTGTANRIATIRVTATGAMNSPTDITVTQAASAMTACTATLDGNLSLHIPFLSYLIPYWGAPSYWADLVYEPNPAYPTWIPFKLTNAATIQSGIFSCEASTLSDDLKIHIPDLLYPDGITRMWVDMEYSPVLSTDSNAYFVVTNYGVVSN
jgi:hypothetical protein